VTASVAAVVPVDSLLDDAGEIPDQQNPVIDRFGRRIYLVRLVDDTRIPDAEETEGVERLAAQRLMQQDAFGQPRAVD